jgi:predicted nucleotidyltransferase
MKSLKDYIPEIKENLIKIDPFKIILFGSTTSEKYHRDSDIDLLVILDSEKISSNYHEKMGNKLLVRNSIYEISKQIPIDLLVYTKKEFEIIEENPNSFFKEISTNGKVIYEKAS